MSWPRRDVAKFNVLYRAVKNFSDAIKKTLAFWIREGVASTPVQGPKISPCSFDGENERDFQWIKWSDLDSVIPLVLGWIRGPSGLLVFTPHSLQVCRNQLSMVVCSTLLAGRLEEAVWIGAVLLE
jgi:hypothetical protein